VFGVGSAEKAGRFELARNSHTYAMGKARPGSIKSGGGGDDHDDDDDDDDALLLSGAGEVDLQQPREAVSHDDEDERELSSSSSGHGAVNVYPRRLRIQATVTYVYSTTDCKQQRQRDCEHMLALTLPTHYNSHSRDRVMRCQPHLWTEGRTRVI
jgi:hypothetical protein